MIPLGVPSDLADGCSDWSHPVTNPSINRLSKVESPASCHRSATTDQPVGATRRWRPPNARTQRPPSPFQTRGWHPLELVPPDGWTMVGLPRGLGSVVKRCCPALARQFCMVGCRSSARTPATLLQTQGGTISCRAPFRVAIRRWSPPHVRPNCRSTHSRPRVAPSRTFSRVAPSRVRLLQPPVGTVSPA